MSLIDILVKAGLMVIVFGVILNVIFPISTLFPSLVNTSIVFYFILSVLYAGILGILALIAIFFIIPYCIEKILKIKDLFEVSCEYIQNIPTKVMNIFRKKTINEVETLIVNTKEKNKKFTIFTVSKPIFKYGKGESAFFEGKAFKEYKKDDLPKKVVEEFSTYFLCPDEEILLRSIESDWVFSHPSINDKEKIVGHNESFHDIFLCLPDKFKKVRKIYCSFSNYMTPKEILNEDGYDAENIKKSYEYGKKHPFLDYKNLQISVILYQSINYKKYYLLLKHPCDRYYEECSNSAFEDFLFPLKGLKRPTDNQIFKFLKENWGWIAKGKKRKKKDTNVYYAHEFFDYEYK